MEIFKLIDTKYSINYHLLLYVLNLIYYINLNLWRIFISNNNLKFYCITIFIYYDNY